MQIALRLNELYVGIVSAYFVYDFIHGGIGMHGKDDLHVGAHRQTFQGAAQAFQTAVIVLVPMSGNENQALIRINKRKIGCQLWY